MSKMYRTARGNYVNMDELRSKNETRVAAGNMNVNSRGDEIGKGGHVVRNVAERARAAQQHSKPVTTKASIKPRVTKEEVEKVQPKQEAEKVQDQKPQEEVDSEGNITVKKPTRGRSKSENKSTEE